MDFQESIFGLAFLGLVAFVTSLAIIFFAYRINRHRLNWYEKNLLETQYLEISPNGVNKTDDEEESGGFWVKGKLKLQKAFSKSSSSSLDALERSSTSASNVVPLVGNNDMIIIASNNSLDEIISTKTLNEVEDAQNNLFINDTAESDVKGTIHLILTYDKQAEILTIRIVEAQDLLARDYTGTADPYVKIRLLPDEVNIWQTKIHKKTINPIFDEDFVFEVPKDSLNTSQLEVVVYDFDANKRHHSLGGVRLPLSSLEKREKLETWEKLRGLNEPSPVSTKGELLVALSYLSTTECLTVSILKARNLQSADNTRSTSDPYVKLTFSCRERRLKKCKTRIRRNTLSPTFNESFVFNISRERLKHGSLQFDVLHDNLIGVDQPLGGCVLGKRKLENGKTKNTLIELLLTKNAAGQWLPLDSA